MIDLIELELRVHRKYSEYVGKYGVTTVREFLRLCEMLNEVLNDDN